MANRASRSNMSDAGTMAEEPLQTSAQSITAGSQAMVKRTLWNKRPVTRYESIINMIFGTIQVNSTQVSLQWAAAAEEQEIMGDEPSEHCSFITLRPAAWIAFLRIRIGLHLSIARSSIQGWNWSLRDFRLVPDDAPIFCFCKEGNLSAVRYLMARGETSARDTDFYGMTPLHVRGPASLSALAENFLACC